MGGGLLDTLSLGVRAALQDTTLPDLTVTGEGEDMEIEVSDNPHDSTPVKVEGAPIITTLYQVGYEEMKPHSCMGTDSMGTDTS